MKWHELETLQRQDLEHKIELAVSVVQRAMAVSRRPALAFSAGKDSTVLVDLIRRFCPELWTRLAVIYGNTGVEYPECVRFARRMASEWNVEFHEARPGKTTEPSYKYAGQRAIWHDLIERGELGQVLKPDGKLKGTETLERACSPELRERLVAQRLVWPAGTLMSYWWCADQFGWPLLGKAWSKLEAHRINIDTFLRFSRSESDNPRLLEYYRVLRQVKISQHCCRVLKKDPSQRVQAELGVDLIFKGLMAAESRSRAKNFLTRGHLFVGAKKDYLHDADFWHCQPMATWTDADVWAYIERYQVPYAALYDMTYLAEDGSRQRVKRNGCLGCGTDFGFRNNHLYVLRQTHRMAWRAIMRAGMAEQIRALQRALHAGQMNIFEAFETDELIDAQPCVFDDVDGTGGREGPDGLVYDPEVE
jgi:3'-phosphoadenosine 5'-phosphosulfate sulfotransferase (PAPS reductase)/FAD synthetase